MSLMPLRCISCRYPLRSNIPRAKKSVEDVLSLNGGGVEIKILAELATWRPGGITYRN